MNTLQILRSIKKTCAWLRMLAAACHKCTQCQVLRLQFYLLTNKQERLRIMVHSALVYSVQDGGAGNY